MGVTQTTQPEAETKRRRRIGNPAGSSNALREDVLRVLGVMKVATADQIQRAAAPHLTYRHTTKPTEAKRKEARTAAHRGALSDLRATGHVLFGGHTRTGEGLRLLTPLGLDAAAGPLGRPRSEMGGAARGAGRSGAQHAMAVNETILALLRPKPDLSLLTGEPAEAVQAARAAAALPGLGTLASYVTEVHLPWTGTWSTQGKSGVQADILVATPGRRVPLLFVEVDNCFEEAAVLAEKVDKYTRFFARQITDTDGQDIPMWRQKWTAPEARWGEPPHPPLLMVFNQIGPRNAKATMQHVADRTRQHWQGKRHTDHTTYDGCIPIVATTLDLLREHGPAGPAFWRFGRPGLQPLDDAVGNPRKDAADAASRAAEARRREQLRAKEAAEREARRPRCKACGQGARVACGPLACGSDVAGVGSPPPSGTCCCADFPSVSVRVPSPHLLRGLGTRAENVGEKAGNYCVRPPRMVGPGETDGGAFQPRVRSGEGLERNRAVNARPDLRLLSCTAGPCTFQLHLASDAAHSSWILHTTAASTAGGGHGTRGRRSLQGQVGRPGHRLRSPTFHPAGHGRRAMQSPTGSDSR